MAGMSQPPPYTPSTDFSDEERDNVGGRSTVRTAALDGELTAIQATLSAVLTNLALNQRDDGEIRDGRVKLFTLASDVLALLTSYGATPRGPWLTATQYNLKDLVSEAGATYIAVSAHTSGVFAADLASGKWLLFSLSIAPGAVQVTFTPTVTVSAVNVQAAIQEVDTEYRAADAAMSVLISGLTTGLADLANTASATKGMGMLGYNEQLAYAAGTGGKALQRAYCPLNHPWLAAGDGTADDTAALAAFFAWLPSNSVADLAGKNYKVYTGVAGVTVGDAIALWSMPRLASKSNITIRNGRIFADSPSASGIKYRFPSTLAVDGCTDIRLQNLQLEAKGENWGDSDASQPLTDEQRRPFLAQNGGHALVCTRSSGIRADAGCKFLRAGSVGAAYFASCDAVVMSGVYASAMSLGYAAFAQDSWCGVSAVSGFARHRLYLNNCRSDNNGASYGSKGCLVTEDKDCYAYVSGGVFKDAYANGSSTMLGAAFTANTSHVYVYGAEVENCAAVGLQTNSGADETVLECRGVTARGLRTSMHIIDRTSFGETKFRFIGCYAEIVGTSLWTETELSVSTVVANRKVTTTVFGEIIGTKTTGAHTFAINERASYGGLRVYGGEHEVVQRIFDSNGWGGASAGTGWGCQLGGGVRFMLTTAAAVSALTQATTAINAIKNQDGIPITTQQLIDIDESVTIESAQFREFMAVSFLGGGSPERRTLRQLLIGAFQAASSSARAYASAVKVIAIGGLSGGNINITFALLGLKRANGGTLIDDTFVGRRFLSISGGPTAVGTELQATFLVNSTTANLTVGTTYPINFSD